MTFGEPNWPRRIGINEEFRAPGSPLHAFTIRSESTGEIPVPFNDSATRCWAQSYVLRSQPLQLMTLILGEPNGKEILSRACAAGRPARSGSKSSAEGFEWVQTPILF